MSEAAPRWRRVFRSPIPWTIPIGVSVLAISLGIWIREPLLGSLWALLLTVCACTLDAMLLDRSRRWLKVVRLPVVFSQILILPLLLMALIGSTNQVVKGGLPSRIDPEACLELTESGYLHVREEYSEVGGPTWNIRVERVDEIPLGLEHRTTVEFVPNVVPSERLVLRRLEPGRAEIRIIYPSGGPLAGPDEFIIFEYEPTD